MVTAPGSQSRWALAHGDCLAVLKTIPDGVVDAVVTDPPYGINYRSKRFGSIANDGAPFVWWLYDAARVLRDGGCLVCFCRWDVQEAFRLAITWAGLRVRSQVVWDKGVHGAGDCAAQFGPQHEVMWFATKGRFRFPAKRPVSVLRAARVPHGRSVHPTEKPAELLQQLLAGVVPAGSLVLDPFVGSGSTGAAALAGGFRFLGVELEQRYFEAARARLAARLRGSGLGNAAVAATRRPKTLPQRLPRPRSQMEHHGGRRRKAELARST